MTRLLSQRTMAVCAFVVLALSLSTILTFGQTRQRIKFQRGRTSAVVKNAVARGESIDYLLGASAGQSMYVHISSEAENAVFSIYAPGRDNPMRGASEVRDWEGNLPSSGDYVINVGTDRGGAEFTLEVTIR
ncbi:MAG: hypothetical protein K1Y36_06900 [Blastocatellia bacterium]|nr:hypothetical protein [Blastocatellia bacterium]